MAQKTQDNVLKLDNQRYPRWFLPMFYVAALCTVAELVYTVDSWAESIARTRSEAKAKSTPRIQLLVSPNSLQGTTPEQVHESMRSMADNFMLDGK